MQSCRPRKVPQATAPTPPRHRGAAESQLKASSRKPLWSMLPRWSGAVGPYGLRAGQGHRRIRTLRSVVMGLLAILGFAACFFTGPPAELSRRSGR